MHSHLLACVCGDFLVSKSSKKKLPASAVSMFETSSGLFTREKEKPVTFSLVMLRNTGVQSNQRWDIHSVRNYYN